MSDNVVKMQQENARLEQAAVHAIAHFLWLRRYPDYIKGFEKIRDRGGRGDTVETQVMWDKVIADAKELHKFMRMLADKMHGWCYEDESVPDHSISDRQIVAAFEALR